MVPVVKNMSALTDMSEDRRDAGQVPGLGRSLGGGHSNILQYSCLENSTYRGSWQAIVHVVTKSGT